MAKEGEQQPLLNGGVKPVPQTSINIQDDTVVYPELLTALKAKIKTIPVSNENLTFIVALNNLKREIKALRKNCNNTTLASLIPVLQQANTVIDNPSQNNLNDFENLISHFRAQWTSLIAPLIFSFLTAVFFVALTLTLLFRFAANTDHFLSIKSFTGLVSILAGAMGLAFIGTLCLLGRVNPPIVRAMKEVIALAAQRPLPAPLPEPVPQGDASSQLKGQGSFPSPSEKKKKNRENDIEEQQPGAEFS